MAETSSLHYSLPDRASERTYLFEAGTEMIRQGLDRLGFPDPTVDSYMERVRQHRYRQEFEQEQEDTTTLPPVTETAVAQVEEEVTAS